MLGPKGRCQNSKDVVTNLPLKLATSGESSQLGSEKLVTVGDNHPPISGAFSGLQW